VLLQITKWTKTVGVGHPNLDILGVRTPMTPTVTTTLPSMLNNYYFIRISKPVIWMDYWTH